MAGAWLQTNINSKFWSNVKVHSSEFLTAGNSNFHHIQMIFIICSSATSQQQPRQDHYITLCGQFLLEEGSLALIVTSPEEITYLLATFA